MLSLGGSLVWESISPDPAVEAKEGLSDQDLLELELGSPEVWGPPRVCLEGVSLFLLS